MKCYLYHKIPKNFSGNILYPLNQLKNIYPEIYEQQFAKYKGREFITEAKIPILDCLWNDVLHFSPVHPEEVFKELKKYDEKDWKPKYYKIPADLLEKENTVVYLFNGDGKGVKSDLDSFKEYNPDDVCNYTELPQETKDYYKEAYESGKAPLLYHKVPHILYKGTIIIDDLEVIEI